MLVSRYASQSLRNAMEIRLRGRADGLYAFASITYHFHLRFKHCKSRSHPGYDRAHRHEAMPDMHGFKEARAIRRTSASFFRLSELCPKSRLI